MVPMPRVAGAAATYDPFTASVWVFGGSAEADLHRIRYDDLELFANKGTWDAVMSDVFIDTDTWDQLVSTTLRFEGDSPESFADRVTLHLQNTNLVTDLDSADVTMDYAGVTYTLDRVGAAIIGLETVGGQYQLPIAVLSGETFVLEVSYTSVPVRSVDGSLMKVGHAGEYEFGQGSPTRAFQLSLPAVVDGRDDDSRSVTAQVVAPVGAIGIATGRDLGTGFYQAQVDPGRWMAHRVDGFSRVQSDTVGTTTVHAYADTSRAGHGALMTDLGGLPSMISNVTSRLGDLPSDEIHLIVGRPDNGPGGISGLYYAGMGFVYELDQSGFPLPDLAASIQHELTHDLFGHAVDFDDESAWMVEAVASLMESTVTGRIGATSGVGARDQLIANTLASTDCDIRLNTDASYDEDYVIGPYRLSQYMFAAMGEHSFTEEDMWWFIVDAVRPYLWGDDIPESAVRVALDALLPGWYDSRIMGCPGVPILDLVEVDVQHDPARSFSDPKAWTGQTGTITVEQVQDQYGFVAFFDHVPFSLSCPNFGGSSPVSTLDACDAPPTKSVATLVTTTPHVMHQATTVLNTQVAALSSPAFPVDIHFGQGATFVPSIPWRAAATETWCGSSLATWGAESCQVDGDGDGVPQPTDCDDSDASVAPGMPDGFDSGDQDCNCIDVRTHGVINVERPGACSAF